MAEVTHALPAGSTIRDEGDNSGNQTTTVTIPAGAPGAGTYTSTSANLADDAKEAKDLAGPGTAIAVTVDGTQIKAISTTKTV